MKAKDMEFDPVDYYEKYLKEGIRQNAASFFDELIKKAAVDEGLNAQTADAFYAAQSEDKANEKVIGRYSATNVETSDNATISGALKAGCSLLELTAALVQALPYIGFPAGLDALLLIARYDGGASNEAYR